MSSPLRLIWHDRRRAFIAKDRAPERVNVFEIMAKPVIAVRPDMSIHHRARLFEESNISHAPVWSDQVIGIISYYLLVLGGLDLD